MTYSLGWPTITARVVSGRCSIRGRHREGRCRKGMAHVTTRWSVLGTPSDHLAMLLAGDAISTQLYPSTCWMVQRLTSRRLANSRWLTPLDRSSLMYSRCCPVRTGRRPGKRPSVRALAWPATERSLIEFRHHSLKASTICSWSFPLAVAVWNSSDREQNSTPAWCRASITCSL